MYFLIEDYELLEKCNTIWDKFSVDIRKEFNSESIFCNKTYLNIKIKSHGNEVTYFYDKKFLNWALIILFLAVISLERCPQERWQLLYRSAFKRV